MLKENWGLGETVLPEDFNNICKDINKNTKDIQYDDISESLLNENTNSFKVGTGMVNGISKDYSKNLEHCRVTLDNIPGYTSPKGPHGQFSIDLHTIYTEAEVIHINDDNTIKLDYSNIDYTFNNGVLEISSQQGETFKAVVFRINAQLDDNATYSLLYDTEIVGSPTIALDGTDSSGVWRDMFNYYRDYYTGFVGNFRFRQAWGLGFKFFSASSVPSGGGTVRFSNIRLIKHKQTVNTDIILRSLPIDIKDEYKKDLGIIRRVGTLNLSHISKDSIRKLDEWSKPETNAFAISIPDMFIVTDNDVIALNCNKFKAISDYDCYNLDGVGIACRIGNKDIVFRVGKGIPTEQALFDYVTLTEKDIIIEYAYEQPTIESFIPPTIEIDTGDIIHIDSPVKFNVEHQVPLNLKSQTIEEISNSTRERKGSWLNFKKYTDFKFALQKNGYIKFPSILGGILIQWGTNKINFRESSNLGSSIINYPITFKQVFSLVGTNGRNDIGAYSQVTTAFSLETNQGFICEIRDDEKGQQASFRTVEAQWIAIGI